MRSWKKTALLATVGLSSLGPLDAQDSLPSSSGLPIVSSPLQPHSSSPMVAAPASEELATVPQSQAPMEFAPGDSSPVMIDSGLSGPAPQSCCGAPTLQRMAGPCQSGCVGVAPLMAPVSSCGCQRGTMMSGGFGLYGGSGDTMMGSGSGVSSGVLSPHANSGGLHVRYPYYNYRHPWYYQGPPSQNVTIIW